MTSELEVRYQGRLCGHLVEDGRANWSFIYAPSWLAQGAAARPISLGLPLSDEPYHGDDVRLVFENLLPEGDVRRQLARRVGLSETNDFSLLGVLAGDCQGALSLNRPGDEGITERDIRVLTDQEFRNIVAALPLRPLLIEVEGARLALPGEHHKIPLTVVDDQLALTLGAEMSTHIAKPAKQGLRESVMNEGYCMQLAAATGLPVASARIRHGPATVLLVDRVDSAPGPGGRKRLHMEDFCQLVHVSARHKFEREGGVSVADCAMVIRRYSVVPAIDLRALIAWVVFNFLVGNGGAHGKQLALLHDDDGPHLAPFFGLSSTHVYPELSQELAMRIGGEDRPDWLIVSKWRSMASELDVKPAYVIGVLRQTAETIPRIAARVAEDFQRRNGFSSVLRDIRRLIEQRSRQVLVSIQAETADFG